MGTVLVYLDTAESNAVQTLQFGVFTLINMLDVSKIGNIPEPVSKHANLIRAKVPPLDRHYLRHCISSGLRSIRSKSLSQDERSRYDKFVDKS